MKDTCEYQALFSDLFEKIEKSRKEQPSAGTKFRLMGLAVLFNGIPELHHVDGYQGCCFGTEAAAA